MDLQYFILTWQNKDVLEGLSEYCFIVMTDFQKESRKIAIHNVVKISHRIIFRHKIYIPVCIFFQASTLNMTQKIFFRNCCVRDNRCRQVEC